MLKLFVLVSLCISTALARGAFYPYCEMGRNSMFEGETRKIKGFCGVQTCSKGNVMYQWCTKPKPPYPSCTLRRGDIRKSFPGCCDVMECVSVA